MGSYCRAQEIYQFLATGTRILYIAKLLRPWHSPEMHLARALWKLGREQVTTSMRDLNPALQHM